MRHFLGVIVLACVSIPVEAQARVSARVLAVFDEVTRSPIRDVEVLDVERGTSALTTASGTVSLAFLPDGTTQLRIRKVGYVAQTLSVRISPADTAAITVFLAPVTATLPSVVTRARQPADTVRKLELGGFYERRQSGRAPASAFTTAEELANWKLTLLSDLKNHTGRAPCGEIFIDGAKLAVAGMSAGRRFGSGIDELVSVGEVAAIEIYSAAEAPSKFLGTTASRTPRCALTLIWLK